MPELPEVETIVRQLNGVLSGKKILKVEVLRPKTCLPVGRAFGDILRGEIVSSVGRKAKMMVISFRNWDKVLIVHLKMTGQLIYLEKTQKLKTEKTQNNVEIRRIVGGHPTADWVNELPSKYTRIIIDFENGEKLFFNDLRVFGWMRVMTNSDWQMANGKLPPDIVDREFTLEYFNNILVRSGRSIKLVLLDQGKIGGVGNIYANDALYKARIYPRRKAKDLDRKEIGELYGAVKEVIDLGIKYGGASVDKYVDATGVGGKYQEHFLVYQRSGEKCKRDGEVIRKIKIGGRGTYYCPGCQK